MTDPVNEKAPCPACGSTASAVRLRERDRSGQFTHRPTACAHEWHENAPLHGRLHERVAAAIFDTAKVGRGTTDNGLRLCSDVADAVLDALGLEQVGWYEPNGWVHNLNEAARDICDATGCVPVYRLAPPPNGRSHECGKFPDVPFGEACSCPPTNGRCDG